MSDLEVIDTQELPDGTEYRVRLEPDLDPLQPEGDGQWPILRWSYRWGFSVEAYNDAGKPYVPKFEEIYRRHGWEVFERYVRIFHGVTKFHEYGPNNGTDYTYAAFDPRAWREEVGTDAEHVAGEKPLAEIEAWIEGDTYGVITEKRWNPDGELEADEGWEDLESVWGYYGRKYAEASARDALEALVNGHKFVHRYTEHEKIAAHQTKIDAILEFLEAPGKGAALCSWERYPSAPHLNAWRPINDGQHQRIVFAHFGIDYAKIEAERELMLKRLREDASERDTGKPE